MTEPRKGIWALALALVIALMVLLGGCAAALPIALGLQGAISAGSDVVGMMKWWEDRKFQEEANKALKAQAEEIKKLREEIARTREQLHEDLNPIAPVKKETTP